MIEIKPFEGLIFDDSLQHQDSQEKFTGPMPQQLYDNIDKVIRQTFKVMAEVEDDEVNVFLRKFNLQNVIDDGDTHLYTGIVSGTNDVGYWFTLDSDRYRHYIEIFINSDGTKYYIKDYDFILSVQKEGSNG